MTAGKPSSIGAPDHDAACDLYRLRACIYDWQMAAYDGIRRHAVDCLALEPGQTVLDLGCGTGMSLAMLSQAVGPGGRVVGVEQSPDMLALAQARVAQQGWSNVQLLASTAEGARLPARADAAMLHFTHDILQLPAAVDHVLRHVRPGGRVVATGLQWTAPWLLPLNALVWWYAMQSVTTLQGLQAPWRPLMAYVPDLKVESFVMGTIYVASGSVGPHPRRRALKAA